MPIATVRVRSRRRHATPPTGPSSSMRPQVTAERDAATEALRHERVAHAATRLGMRAPADPAAPGAQGRLPSTPQSARSRGRGPTAPGSVSSAGRGGAGDSGRPGVADRSGGSSLGGGGLPPRHAGGGGGRAPPPRAPILPRRDSDESIAPSRRPSREAAKGEGHQHEQVAAAAAAPGAGAGTDFPPPPVSGCGANSCTVQ